MCDSNHSTLANCQTKPSFSLPSISARQGTNLLWQISSGTANVDFVISVRRLPLKVFPFSIPVDFCRF
jgi:hypothetical protein